MKNLVKSKLEERSSTENSADFYKSQMDEDFLKAAKAGDLNRVQECLNAGVNVHVTNPGGLNALHFAARENHPDVARLVLKHGIDITNITKKLNTALHMASLGGNKSVAQILLEHKAPLNVQAKDDITPLYMAAQENHVDLVKLLLKAKADPHIAAEGGFEPVDISIQQGHAVVATMLLEHDAKGGLRALHVAARRDDVTALELLVTNKKNVNERAPNGYSPLHIAAKHGSVKAANYLIDHGADLNAAAKHNIVPLHVAARHGQMGVLAILIEAGANLAISTKDGLSSLHCAARDGHEHCVELLVVHSAPLTAKTKHGLTALHMAAQGNHTTSANHLLSHGAHIDDVTLDGVTPLHVTAHYGHLETAKLLLEKGADFDRRARNGYTALHIASKKNREPVVQLLLRYKTSVHVKNNNGQTALHVAAFFGNVNIVLLLLQAGASLEATTIREETVLHIACRTTQLQIVRLLLRNGAKVNPKSKDEDTPLHNACRQGSMSMVSLLLDNQADPNAVNKEGCAALHLAARDGHEKVLDNLLDHNADVTVSSKRGFTPLHEAAKNGCIPIIEMLLARKANVNAKAKNGLTPLHIACHYDRPDAAIKLLDDGADAHATAKNGFTPLHIASKKNQVNIVALLLDRAVEADLTTKNGISPLHLAAKEGNCKIVDLLLDNGASPGIQTTNGLTPLHVAVHYNQIEVVRKLLKFGATIDAATQSGFTPLHLAALYGHYDVAEYLLAEGAEVESKNKNGNTPLHLAAYNGHKDVVELLLRYNAPPNALNKDGYTALYIAELAQQTWVVNTLVQVTTVTTKLKLSTEPQQKASNWDKIKASFLPPEGLEEALLIEAVDEAEDEADLQRKIVQDDFEESFPGLDETRSEHNQSFMTESEFPTQLNDSYIPIQVDEGEIQVSQAKQVESMADNYDDDFKQLDGQQNGVHQSEHVKHNGIQNGRPVITLNGDFVRSDEDVSDLSNDVQNINYPDNVYITGPPKQGGFLISFNVDARGGTMESKQTGVRIVIPRGACRMPTRITCRLKKSSTVANLPKLNPNEALASRVVQLSPEGTQFLKPVTLEIPHTASLCGKERELIVLRCNSGHSSWKEHVSTLVDDEQELESDQAKIKVIIQDIPEKLIIVSRPRKERFLMMPEGGIIESTVLPKVQINFPAETLNMSTKVLLQVQRCEDSLLQADDQTYVSPIVSLEPPTVLSKPISISIPCPWLNYEEKSAKRNLSLLAWLPRSPRRSTGDRMEYDWQDITSRTALSIIRDSVSFTTTEFTRYWIVQTTSVETLPKRIAALQEAVSAAPYSAQFIVYSRMTSKERVELRVFLVTDENVHKKLLQQYTDLTEVARSANYSLYSNQTIHVNISGNFAPSNTMALKMVFEPFKLNRLKIPIELIAGDIAHNCRLTFIGSLRRNLTNKVPMICHLDARLDSSVLVAEKQTFPLDTVDDKTIQMVGNEMAVDSWMSLADELGMNKQDKQAVVDISSGKNDVICIRLLEFWRSKKPSSASYKVLFDTLKILEYDELASNVYNNAPNKFSTDILPRQKDIEPATPPASPVYDSIQPTTSPVLDDVNESRHEVCVAEPDDVSRHGNKPIETTAKTYHFMEDLLGNDRKKEDVLHDTDILIDSVLADPSIDFGSLERLDEETTNPVNYEIQTGPTDYELSLIRQQEEEEQALEKCVPTRDQELILEDIVSDMKIEPIESEVDFLVFDKDAPNHCNETLESSGVNKDESHLSFGNTAEVKTERDTTDLSCSTDRSASPLVISSPEVISVDTTYDDLNEHVETRPVVANDLPIVETTRTTTEGDTPDSYFVRHEEVSRIEYSPYEQNNVENGSVVHSYGHTNQVLATTVLASTQKRDSARQDDVTFESQSHETVVLSKQTTVTTQKMTVSNDESVRHEETVTSDETTTESGEDLIKRMFGNQSNVLEFFDEPIEDDDEYGTAV